MISRICFGVGSLNAVRCCASSRVEVMAHRCFSQKSHDNIFFERAPSQLPTEGEPGRDTMIANIKRYHARPPLSSSEMPIPGSPTWNQILDNLKRGEGLPPLNVLFKAKSNL